jgi:hypothetical protein
MDQDIVADQVVCSSNSSSALDLLAPGVLIKSPSLGGGQSERSGTSLSTAHASAVAALVLQAASEISPGELETIMKESGVPVTDSRNGRVTRRLDALAAVRRVTDGELIAISGIVLLQGRSDHSGSDIFLSEEPCSAMIADTPVMTTEVGGRFEIVRPLPHNYQCLQVVKNGYLIGQQDTPHGDLGIITLPGGDVNGDGMIDIFDLAFIASRYQSDYPVADINDNGLVDIFDLVIVAGNYNQTGPISQWNTTTCSVEQNQALP